MGHSQSKAAKGLVGLILHPHVGLMARTMIFIQCLKSLMRWALAKGPMPS